MKNLISLEQLKSMPYKSAYRYLGSIAYAITWKQFYALSRFIELNCRRLAS